MSMQALGSPAGTLVTLADTADHPARLTAHLPGEKPRRIESFNDKLLASFDLGTGSNLENLTLEEHRQQLGCVAGFDGASGQHLGQPLVGVCNTLWYRDAAYYAVPWRG